MMSVLNIGRRSTDESVLHAVIVVLAIIAATVLATVDKKQAGNAWIVYGSAIAYVGGRSGARASAQRTEKASV